MSKIKTTVNGRPLYVEKSTPQKRAYMKWWRNKNRASYNKKRLEWTWKNRQKRSLQSRTSYLKVRFNLSIDDFNKLLSSQKRKCKICKIKFKFSWDSKARVRMDCFVDHDHKTNKVRGILCMNCNTGLGHFKDNKNLLQETIKYLT